MDDTLHGVRNKRGDWTPSAQPEIAPFWHWPPRPLQVLRWLPGYVWPWNLLHLLTALAWWIWVVPDAQTLRTLGWSWPLWLLAVNWLACGLWYGAFEWRLYRRRAQAGRFKYHAKFPSEQASDVFWFRNQNIDNALRSFGVSIPLWTLVQVMLLWCWANGVGSWLSWQTHPGCLLALLFVAPALHELHFYLIHRAIHWGPLYRWIHSIHHNSINPSPISSLSMHPVEAFLYHAVALWHVLLPSNPVVALFQLHAAGFGAINGHIGFEKIELGGERCLASHAYLHHLHHKHFEVNYGGDGLIPLDHWFGTWHDGSKACELRMQARYERKVARLNAGKTTG
jgi:sterol desaturase/sphingolipid hydroxylase (fatty acid hydroxylase superfamily)